MSARVALYLRKQGFKKAFPVLGGLNKMPEGGFLYYRAGDIFKNGKMIFKKK